MAQPHFSISAAFYHIYVSDSILSIDNVEYTISPGAMLELQNLIQTCNFFTTICTQRRRGEMTIKWGDQENTLNGTNFMHIVQPIVAKLRQIAKL